MHCKLVQSGSVPEGVKIIAQDSGADDQHSLGRVSIPTHTRACQALLKLFNSAFNRTRPNGQAFFSKFKLWHPPLVTFKVAGEVVSLPFFQHGNDVVNTPHVEMVLVGFEPSAAFWAACIIGIEGVGSL